MVIGLDLATRLTGAALVRGSGRVRVAALEPLKVEPSLVGARRIVDWVLERRPELVAIERPPQVLPRDLKHGSQAALGWTLGRMSGLVEALLDEHGVPAVLVDVSEWRDTMLATSTAWGLPAYKPGAPPPTPTPMFGRQRIRVEWRGADRVLVWSCGHERPLPSLDALSTVGDCPTCTAPVRAQRRSDWVREAWKRLACELTRAHWPEPYAALVADVRGRARTTKADHELVGIADSCEAVWIAVHGAQRVAATAAA